MLNLSLYTKFVRCSPLAVPAYGWERGRGCVAATPPHYSRNTSNQTTQFRSRSRLHPPHPILFQNHRLPLPANPPLRKPALEYLHVPVLVPVPVQVQALLQVPVPVPVPALAEVHVPALVAFL